MPPEKGPLLKSKGTIHFKVRWKGASTPGRIETDRETRIFGLRRTASGRQSSCDAVAIGRPRFNFTSLNRPVCCDPDGVANTEADHFGNCPVCGAYIDMRDLAQMVAHVQDAEIEISEGPEPPPRQRVQ